MINILIGLFIMLLGVGFGYLSIITELYRYFFIVITLGGVVGGVILLAWIIGDSIRGIYDE